MPELDHFRAVRVVANPAALNGAVWGNEDAIVIRLAPDEVLAIGTTHVAIADPDAIVELEAGFVIGYLSSYDVDLLAEHVDWPIPEISGAVSQGKIAGVPAKLVIGEPSRIVVQAAYADELRERLGWR